MQPVAISNIGELNKIFKIGTRRTKPGFCPCTRTTNLTAFRDEEATRHEYATLFTDEEPKAVPIPIIYNPPEGIDDQPPDEAEVVAALKKLKLGKSPGASGIRVEDLREWHRLAREIEEEAGEPLEEDVEIWEKVLKCSPKCCD